MRAVAMKVREEKRDFRPKDFGQKNALAKIVRNRWPSMTIENVRVFYDLTEGEARGVNYAQASQRTIDKMLKHPNGGWPLALEMLEETIGQRFADFIETEHARLDAEARRARETADALGSMGHRLTTLLGVGDRGSDRPGPRRLR